MTTGLGGVGRGGVGAVLGFVYRVTQVINSKSSIVKKLTIK